MFMDPDRPAHSLVPWPLRLKGDPHALPHSSQDRKARSSYVFYVRAIGIGRSCYARPSSLDIEQDGDRWLRLVHL